MNNPNKSMIIEQIKEATSATEMRAEISRLRRYDGLIQKVMTAADYNGFSSEDRYTMLAYYALVQLEKTKQALEDYVLTTPNPPSIFVSKND